MDSFIYNQSLKNIVRHQVYKKIMKSIDNKFTQLQKSDNSLLNSSPISQSKHKTKDIEAIKTSYATIIEHNKYIFSKVLFLVALIILGISNKDQLISLFSPEPEFQLEDVIGVTYFENGKEVNTVDNIDPKTKKWLEEYYQNKK